MKILIRSNAFVVLCLNIENLNIIEQLVERIISLEISVDEVLT